MAAMAEKHELAIWLVSEWSSPSKLAVRHSFNRSDSFEANC